MSRLLHAIADALVHVNDDKLSKPARAWLEYTRLNSDALRHGVDLITHLARLEEEMDRADAASEGTDYETYRARIEAENRDACEKFGKARRFMSRPEAQRAAAQHNSKAPAARKAKSKDAKTRSVPAKAKAKRAA